MGIRNCSDLELKMTANKTAFQLKTANLAPKCLSYDIVYREELRRLLVERLAATIVDS